MVEILLDYKALESFQGWEGVFGKKAPLKVDMGCGKDPFLIQCAMKDPKSHFIGVEQDSKIAYRFENKVRKSGLENIRVLHFEGHFALQRFFLPESIDHFFLQFPDPWPKKRHVKRRILSVAFVKELWQKLKPTGEFFIATDVQEIAQLGQEVVGQAGGFERMSDEKPYPFLTLYEEKFLKQKLPIYYQRYKKV
ncbi:MAG: tRNA (guanosine(46)-N7)-methyltransferase TrmB [Chlamydiae bacterium]|nr:tRNA (guanosine(46)-N7)-methyltransferase TrmB [Chlamydiota bacterium]MBI3265465.1 tRNA (guanosine(46)-N7)-methyltransferase TrmB [Chlamydiota bacterium]